MSTKLTNAQIFESVKSNGFISEREINLLKNRSNRVQSDLFDYDFMEHFLDGYGLPVSEEQGEKGLTWLKKFISKKDDYKNVGGASYSLREFEIIKNATAKDFTFRGFYNAGNRWQRFYLPIYELNGMEYVPMRTPYIVG